MSKILVIEDSSEINSLLCEILKQDGHETKSAFSGTEGLLYLQMDGYDLVLLDLMLPGMAGEDILKSIRKSLSVPVIVISAKTGIEGKVSLLENGANDYITKPFDVREVLARVHLQLNKKEEQLGKNVIIAGEMEIDSNLHEVRVCGNNLSLTPQEFNIMYQLFSHPNKAFTKQELYESAWNEYYMGADKTLNVHISNIRNKIRTYTEKQYIDTVWGIGFKALM